MLRQALEDDRWGVEDGGVISRIQSSGLRGMGGAGFGTGLKWQLVSEESEATRYVICNADESEPGTFKDRADPRRAAPSGSRGPDSRGPEHSGRARLGLHSSRVRAGRASAAAGHRRRLCLGSARRQRLRVGLRLRRRDLHITWRIHPRRRNPRCWRPWRDVGASPRNKPPYPGRKGLWDKPTPDQQRRDTGPGAADPENWQGRIQILLGERRRPASSGLRGSGGHYLECAHRRVRRRARRRQAAGPFFRAVPARDSSPPSTRISPSTGTRYATPARLWARARWWWSPKAPTSSTSPTISPPSFETSRAESAFPAESEPRRLSS